jgi:DNA-binding transcriptional LysR family regulator
MSVQVSRALPGVSNSFWDAATTNGCANLGVVDLDLAQVRAFVAVVDHGHFGRAAQTLAVSQQGLSKRVARLEGQLGPLLERRRGGVALTAAGERFLPAARQLLEVADHAIAEVRSTPSAPLRVDVWSDLQSPAQAVRAIARDQPDIPVELSMRRDLMEALGALQRHEIDLAFGNVADLPNPLASELSAELAMVDTIAALVSAHSGLADRDRITSGDLVRCGIWWPMAGSSQELRAFIETYAQSIGATLVADGVNLGLDAAVQRVADDPTLILPVVSTWPLATRTDVRVLPLSPAPRYPWHAVWRTASTHPSLPRILRALRAARARAHPAGESA